jgi:hypothetical protein
VSTAAIPGAATPTTAIRTTAAPTAARAVIARALASALRASLELRLPAARALTASALSALIGGRGPLVLGRPRAARRPLDPRLHLRLASLALPLRRLAGRSLHLRRRRGALASRLAAGPRDSILARSLLRALGALAPGLGNAARGLARQLALRR